MITKTITYVPQQAQNVYLVSCDATLLIKGYWFKFNSLLEVENTIKEDASGLLRQGQVALNDLSSYKAVYSCNS
jgi:hypothetical protein